MRSWGRALIQLDCGPYKKWKLSLSLLHPPAPVKNHRRQPSTSQTRRKFSLDPEQAWTLISASSLQSWENSVLLFRHPVWGIFSDSLRWLQHDMSLSNLDSDPSLNLFQMVCFMWPLLFIFRNSFISQRSLQVLHKIAGNFIYFEFFSKLFLFSSMSAWKSYQISAHVNRYSSPLTLAKMSFRFTVNILAPLFPLPYIFISLKVL